MASPIDCAPSIDYSSQGNFLTAGSGWSTISAVANGQFPYVDIDTLFGGATPNLSLYLPDGLHPSSKGHRLIARTIFSVIRNNYSPDQLISR